MSGNDFKKIQSRFEKDAKAFDSIYSDGSEFNTWFNRRFRKPIFERFDLVDQLMGDIKGKNVLDIGCGSGVYIVNFAAKGAAFVLGVDFSQPMLDIAKRRVESQNFSTQCEFRVANFLETDFNQKFDVTIAIGVFDYLANPEPFLKKMKEVTQGKIIISFPGHSLIRGALRKLRYLFTSKGSVYFYSKKRIEDLVKAVGFSHYEVIPMKTGSGFVLLAQP